MGSLYLDIAIDAPPDAVFRLITDLEGAVERITGIEQIELLTSGPMEVGTRWRESRRMMGHSATEELEVIRFDPGVGYTAACESCGCYYESAFRCVAKGEVTQLSMTLTWRALTLAAKLMSPLSSMMAGTMKKCIEQDLIDLKRAAESASV